MMQLTTEQHVFSVSEWIRTGSLQEVANRFGERFPERPVPVKSTIWKNVRKHQREGTSLNLNKGWSGRRRTASTDANIRAMQELLYRNPNVSVRRNSLGIAPSTFNNIVRLDIQWYTYKMIRRHQLLSLLQIFPGDYDSANGFWINNQDSLNSLLLETRQLFS